MTFSQYKKQVENTIIKNERLFIAAFLLIFALLTVVDVIEDLYNGSGFAHVFFEVIVVAITLLISIVSFRAFVKDRNQNISIAYSEVAKVKVQAQEWKQKTQQLSSGVSNAIVQQLKDWRLSEAEQDVAFLLLKGLSLKEIADVRQSSERTIRQQASVIYKKSGLAGRAELSAFFLEDLFARD